MEITIYRDQPVDQEERVLPGDIYNLAHGLLARSPNGTVFVPIRSMQVLAILDPEEFVFLDSQDKAWVEIAWRGFRPQGRDGLAEPVPYTAMYYQPGGAERMRRLQPEFAAALRALSEKGRPEGPARVLKFTRPEP